MDLGFLKTKQKNTNIPFSNFDFSHDNDYTSQLGQMLVTQCTKILPNDKLKHRINEETILQPLENPSFTKFKHVHKSFYYPNTVLWKYWDNFLTNKPDDLWTNSDITSYINERQPYSIPKCYFKDLLPYLALSDGFFDDFTITYYLPQSAYILKRLGKLDNLDQYPLNRFHVSPFIPYLEGIDTYANLTIETGDLVPALTANYENYFYQMTSAFDVLFRGQTDVDNYLQSLIDLINNSSLTTEEKTRLKSYCTANNLRFYCRFKIVSQSINKISFQPLYALNGLDINDFANSRFIKDKNSFLNLLTLDPSAAPSLRTSQVSEFDEYLYIIKNEYHDYQSDYYVLPMPSAVESSAFGFTPLGFFFYNIRNIAKHLDMMGINLPNDFINFTRQDLFTPINLLPFIAYNRFYHEEVADKQRQVNCPSWEYANGLICPYGNAIEKQSSSLEKYQDIGWTLHFDDIPYNKHYNLQDIKITTCNPFSAAMLLTGFDINLLTTNHSYSNFEQISDSYISSPCVVSFLQPVFQIYNGLLHLQYANFAPDYFNSSVMDPLAGAQDIQIPSTITQLQEKSKLQELLNQTAWTRNIKEFLQSQFDAFSKYTTIDDPVITGSCDVDVNISQVLQTSESTDNSSLGQRAGVGSGYGNGWLCDNEFHEFGYYITVSYFVMNSTYINRLDKQLIAESNYLELPFPQLSNLGNEAISMHEVKFGQANTFGNDPGDFSPISLAPYIHSYAAVFDGSDSTYELKPLGGTPHNPHMNHSLDNKPLPDMIGDGSVNGSNVNFGYIPRFSSYKFKFDQVHGEFLKSLKNWVNTRELQILPLQTYTFVSYECQAQLSNLMKNFVDKNQLISDSFLTNSVNIMSVRRCLPFVVNPSL